jgi:hypothetical protein
MDEVPDRDTLLAMRAPAELFGDAAADGKALRRAWARVVRTYTPDDDPEAFQHARALFERARDALETPTVTPAVVPEPALREALENQDFHEVFRVLRAFGPQLAAQSPDTLGRAIRITLMAVGARCGPTALDDLELLLGRPEWTPDPALIRECEDDLIFLRALAEAANDPRVPPELIAAIRAMFRRGAETALETFADLTKELQPDRLGAALDHLFFAHGTVARQIVRSEILVANALRDRDAPTLPEAELDALRSATADDYMAPVADGQVVDVGGDPKGARRLGSLGWTAVAQITAAMTSTPWWIWLALLAVTVDAARALWWRRRLQALSASIPELSRHTAQRWLRLEEQRRAFVVVCGLLVASLCALVRPEPDIGVVLFIGMAFYLPWHFYFTVAPPRSPWMARPAETQALLERALTESGATPHELASLIVGDRPFPVDLRFSWQPDHPLLVLESAPGALLRHAGPALRARLAARGGAS